MEEFSYQDGELCCEDLPMSRIAKEVGTPFYCYSAAHIIKRFRAYDQAFGDRKHLICFAVKANSNLAILNLLGKLGAGADIVSGGELFRALRAGIPANRIVFSGVGKTTEEIQAALDAGILMFNIESMQEFHAIAKTCRETGKKARISFRVNPDVDPKTHPYISTGLKKNKFGMPVHDALEAYREAKRNPHVEITGIDCHIGSQLTQIQPFLDALDRVAAVVQTLNDEGIQLSYLDTGGGLGIRYHDETPPDPGKLIRELIKRMDANGLQQTVIVEPGRSICGNAGALVTKVLYTKENSGKTFVIVDAAMNDLPRPSLYQAYHDIWHLNQTSNRKPCLVDIVGPICETGDFLAKEREMPLPAQGELLSVMSAGAYGFSMSSNYNSRPRIPEVLVNGSEFRVIRKRESYEDLVRIEEIS